MGCFQVAYIIFHFFLFVVEIYSSFFVPDIEIFLMNCVHVPDSVCASAIWRRRPLPGIAWVFVRVARSFPISSVSNSHWMSSVMAVWIVRVRPQVYRDTFLVLLERQKKSDSRRLLFGRWSMVSRQQPNSQPSLLFSPNWSFFSSNLHLVFVPEFFRRV